MQPENLPTWRKGLEATQKTQRFPTQDNLCRALDLWNGLVTSSYKTSFSSTPQGTSDNLTHNILAALEIEFLKVIGNSIFAGFPGDLSQILASQAAWWERSTIPPASDASDGTSSARLRNQQLQDAAGLILMCSIHIYTGTAELDIEDCCYMLDVAEAFLKKANVGSELSDMLASYDSRLTTGNIFNMICVMRAHLLLLSDQGKRAHCATHAAISAVLDNLKKADLCWYSLASFLTLLKSYIHIEDWKAMQQPAKTAIIRYLAEAEQSGDPCRQGWLLLELAHVSLLTDWSYSGVEELVNDGTAFLLKCKPWLPTAYSRVGVEVASALENVLASVKGEHPLHYRDVSIGPQSLAGSFYFQSACESMRRMLHSCFWCRAIDFKRCSAVSWDLIIKKHQAMVYNYGIRTRSKFRIKLTLVLKHNAQHF